MFEVDIYIETSLKGPGRRAGWYAAVLEYRTKNHGIETREVFEWEEDTTFYQSALRALIGALQRLNTGCALTIHTGCMYLITVYDRFLDMWEQNGFRNSRNEPIKNQDEWKQLAELLKQHDPLIVWERKHEYTSWMEMQAVKRFGDRAKVPGDSVNTECEGNLDHDKNRVKNEGEEEDYER